MYGSPINTLRFKDEQLRFKGSPELRRRGWGPGASRGREPAERWEGW